MKVLVFEFFTGVAHADLCLGEAAYREANLMTIALCSDLAALEDIEVSVFRDKRLPSLDLDIPVLTAAVGEDWFARLENELLEFDALWPVVPESWGLLEKVSALCESKGKLLLNSSSSAVAVTASKYQTSQVLGHHRVPCIFTGLLRYKPYPPGQVVVKPDDGFSSGMTRVYSSSSEIAKDTPRTHVVQPYISGEPASLSVVAGEKQCCLVGINRQVMERRGDELRLHCCKVNAYAELGRDRFQPLVERIYAIIPGLQGFFGIDIILQKEKTIVVEINPRLTAPYVKLSDSLGVNVAELVLKAVTGQHFKQPSLKHAKSFDVL